MSLPLLHGRKKTHGRQNRKPPADVPGDLEGRDPFLVCDLSEDPLLWISREEEVPPGGLLPEDVVQATLDHHVL